MAALSGSVVCDRGVSPMSSAKWEQEFFNFYTDVYIDIQNIQRRRLIQVPLLLLTRTGC